MNRHRCYGCMAWIEEETCPLCGYGSDENNTVNQLPLGTVLNGKYLVGRVLGQGGFGITYIGMDTDLDRVVAIKEFFPAAMVNRNVSEGLTVRLNAEDSRERFESSRERFLREAKALAKLQNVPQVVSVRQLFTEYNTAYIVMEYVRGKDLRHLVREHGGTLAPEILFPILDQVLQGLSAVHRAGLVHRDISPDNIMLQPDGTVKVLDFGAVREVGASDADIDLSHSTEAILKHGFAPMEQYRSRGNLGPWTDEYGICASVYYCLTGRVPPDAASRAMGDEDVDWSAVPGLEPHQRAALEKGMSMRARDRYGDVETLRKALFEKPGTDEMKEQDEEAEPKEEDHPKPWGMVSFLVVLTLTILLTFVGIRWLSSLQVRTVIEYFGISQEDVIGYVLEQAGFEPNLSVDNAEESEPVAEETESTEDGSPPVRLPWATNVMMRQPMNDLAKAGIPKEYIQSVVFLDSLADAPANRIDVSLFDKGSVFAWVDWSHGCTVYFAAENGINGRISSENLFEGCTALAKVTFGGAYHTDEAESMASMFAGCISLESVDVETLNTGMTQDMSGMFSLVSGKAKNMAIQYTYNERLEYLDLSSWDMSQIRFADRMFYGCKGLKELNTAGWTFSKIRKLSEMFALSGLRNLDAVGWKLNTSLPVLMDGMFRDCENLVSVDLSGWNTECVINVSDLFKNCINLQSVRMDGWNTSSVKTISGMFKNCSRLEQLDVSCWDVGSVQDMQGAFSGCVMLKELSVGSWDTACAQNMSELFYNCVDLKELDVGNWDVCGVTDMCRMFSGCGIREIDVNRWHVSQVMNMEEMFYECTELYDLDTSDWVTGSQLKYNNFCSEWTRVNHFTWQEYFWNRKLT